MSANPRARASMKGIITGCLMLLEGIGFIYLRCCNSKLLDEMGLQLASATPSQNAQTGANADDEPV